MKAFTRFSRLIENAAREGKNLDSIITDARAVNMPKALIDRAVKRATSKDETEFETLTYEGVGPESSAFLITAATDNKNRCRDLIRAVFNKQEGQATFGSSTSFLFDTRGEVVVLAEEEEDDEDLLAACLDAGAEDVEWGSAVDLRSGEPASAATVICPPLTVSAVESALQERWHIVSASVVRKPTAMVQLSEPALEVVQAMIDGLQQVEGVEEVAHNVEMPTDE